jgi:hypothetical protein
MDYKNEKWARKIIELQNDDGSWGYFHSLSNPTPEQPMTTEQALRRLEILGFTIDDKPIKKAVKYMNDCLTGKNRIHGGMYYIYDKRLKEYMRMNLLE